MKNLTGGLIAGACFLFLITQFPLLIKFFVLLFMVVGAYSLALVQTNPILFSVGFILLYGVTKNRN
jgi:hypothetical protein